MYNIFSNLFQAMWLLLNTGCYVHTVSSGACYGLVEDKIGVVMSVVKVDNVC